MSRWSSKPVAAVLLVTLIQLGVPVGTSAQTSTSTPPPQRASTTKRVVWTLIGAGIGFGAGVMFGLNRFDDATNSDRKVWISAIVGAVAGGIAGGTLSRDMTPGFIPEPRTKVADSIVLPSMTERPDFALRSRVAAANTRAFSLGGGAQQPRTARAGQDPLWEGMAVGAAIGAGIGLIAVPEKECTPVNPECPKMLRIGVGIPAIALGAALGALADKVWK
jgi:hypothetical protein